MRACDRAPRLAALTAAAAAAGVIGEGVAGADAYEFQLRQRLDCFGGSLVVGHQPCGRFGRWAIPDGLRFSITLGVPVRLMKDVGLELSRFRDPAVAQLQTGSATETAGRGKVDLTSFAGSVRATGELTRFAYLGLEVAFGGIQVRDWRSDLIDIDEANSVYYHGGAVVGVLGHAGPLLLRGEVFTGARVIELFAVHATRGATLEAKTEVAIEPRAGAELWIAPWTTLGALIGTDVVHQTLLFGVTLNFYNAAFDDSRRGERNNADYY